MGVGKVPDVQASIVFVEAAQTGSGLVHLQWALDNGFDAWFVTADPRKYRNAPFNDVLSILSELGRVLVYGAEGDAADLDIARLVGERRASTGVVCVSDRYLQLAASIARRVGASFLSEVSVECLRDKRRMRALFDELRVPTTRWHSPRTSSEVTEFVSEVGGPIVLKNCKGTGSLDVVLSFGDDAADRFCELQRSVRYLDGQIMLEEYIAGPLFSLELVINNKAVMPLGATDRQLGPHPHFCEISYTFPAELPEETTAVVVDAVRRVATALTIDYCVLHVEFIVAEDGPRIVEINPRLGGGLLPLMMDACLTNPTSEILCRLSVGALDAMPHQNGRASSTVTVYAGEAGRLRSLNGVQFARAMPFIRDVVSVAECGSEVATARDYRGALCQIWSIAGSAPLAYNSAVAASQFVSAEIEREIRS